MRYLAELIGTCVLLLIGYAGIGWLVGRFNENKKKKEDNDESV